MSGTSRLTRIVLIAISAMGATPTAWGWGCKGHEIVALVAEAHLTPRARAMAFKILADSPINPALARYCKEQGLDPFVDSSTWADDERNVLPETGPWHFIDIPRGAPENSISEYCPPATGCVTSALATQLGILRDSGVTAQARADALRFVIHFVGDIHQPLHDTTNNDRGGNCVPVEFFGTEPQTRNPQSESYSPNLHSVWDSSISERMRTGKTGQQFAAETNAAQAKRIRGWMRGTKNFDDWAWEGHELAETAVYGKLPHLIPVEKPA